MPTKNRVNGKQPTANATPASPTAKPSNNGNPLSNSDRLRKLYASLLRCRRLQECIRDASEATGSNYELTIGHEAVVVGATADLDNEDTIVASPRNVNALLARGVPLDVLLSQTSHVGTVERYLAQHAIEGPFHAGVGIAVAHMLEKKRNVVVAFAPPGKATIAAWHSALQFAAQHKLRIVFVIENGFAAGTDSQESYLEAVSFMARDCGLPGIIVDGQDVVAVWRVAQEAIRHARDGSGPTLIDCRTDPVRDPLSHMQRYLRKRNQWDDDWSRQLEREIRESLEQVLSARAPQPPQGRPQSREQALLRKQLPAGKTKDKHRGQVDRTDG